MDAQTIEALRNDAAAIHIDPQLEQYIVDLVFATREPNPYLRYGASPRATIDLFKAAKARAFLDEKDYVAPSDIARVAKEVLRHRLVLSYEGEAEGVTADAIIDKILQEVPIP